MLISESLEANLRAQRGLHGTCLLSTLTLETGRRVSISSFGHKCVYRASKKNGITMFADKMCFLRILCLKTLKFYQQNFKNIFGTLKKKIRKIFYFFVWKNKFKLTKCWFEIVFSIVLQKFIKKNHRKIKYKKQESAKKG